MLLGDISVMHRHAGAYTPLFVLYSINLFLTLRYGCSEFQEAVSSVSFKECFFFFYICLTTVKKD